MERLDLRERLQGRLGKRDIELICISCSGEANDANRQALYDLIEDEDERVVYNALWVFTHFSDENIHWLRRKRNILIDMLLNKFDNDAGAKREGKVRMTLALLERLPISAEDIRTDYLDYCLSRINSLEPYGIRALCMKQAYRQCCYYPELLNELRSEIELMDSAPLSPGLTATRRNLLRKLRVK